ncbi:hypothetical protein QTP88_023394 [Uroleucon formosanum]
MKFIHLRIAAVTQCVVLQYHGDCGQQQQRPTTPPETYYIRSSDRASSDQFHGGGEKCLTLLTNNKMYLSINKNRTSNDLQGAVAPIVFPGDAPAVNMYRRHESLISQVTKTADDVPVIVTRLASTEKNDIDYYPFSQVLRIRVLQIVCGILAVVMGSVACIEEKGSFGNLGLGIPTGLSTVLAAVLFHMNGSLVLLLVQQITIEEKISDFYLIKLCLKISHVFYLPQMASLMKIADNIKQLIEMYQDYLDCGKLAAVGEIKTWQQKCVKTQVFPKNALYALQECNETIYPSTLKLLQILATLPVTTTSSERSFSTLKRFKTYLRNMTCENRLNGLALLNIYREIILQPEDVLNKLAIKTRRIRLM